nr:endonuclease MutS2 [Deltaproteobacteria bacterium]
MDSHTRTVLEFDKIIAFVSQFATSAIGRQASSRLAPLTDFSSIRQRLEEVSEMKALNAEHDLLPLSGLVDSTDLLAKAAPQESFLLPQELLAIQKTIVSARLTQALFESIRERYPLLRSIASRLKVLAPLESMINEAITSDAEIRDSASPALQRIRVSITQTKMRVRSLLDDILNSHSTTGLQERYITIRNDRYVIPVRSDFRKQVPGVVHDQSRHQATCFVEPFSVVELNNSLHLLKEEERDEEILILKNITDMVRESRESLFRNQRCLALLDAIQAKARFSTALDACSPQVVDSGEIRLRAARHPLLAYVAASDQGPGSLPLFTNPDVVPIDLEFPVEYMVSIITGANMGGKTAALKTLGLLTLMVQAGMHIPVSEGSTISLWKAVFADIGDEQDLEQHVSTFSSHLNFLTSILDRAQPSSLVLLDEVGTGTDPQEGGALALAVIDELRLRKAKVVVTSHLNLLKSYAITTSDVMNISVAFDSDTLQPSYRLIYGVPGSSKAFETAARLGMNPAILQKAAAYLGDAEHQNLQLVEAMREKVDAVVRTYHDLESLLRSAAGLEASLSQLLVILKDRRASLLAQTDRKAKEILREVERLLKAAKKKSARPAADDLGAMKQRLSELKQHLQAEFTPSEPEMTELGELHEGDRIAFGGGDQKGQVIDIDDHTHTVEIQVGGVRIKARKDDLSKIRGATKESGRPAAPFQWSTEHARPLVLPLNVVGMRVDQALSMIDKALDDSLLSGQKELRIIHGFGTGRLQQAVHQHLAEHPAIAGFVFAPPLEGGAGVTVVELQPE